MPELSDFAVELVSLGVDAIVCTVIYQGFKHVKKTLIDVKVRESESEARAPQKRTCQSIMTFFRLLRCCPTKHSTMESPSPS